MKCRFCKEDIQKEAVVCSTCGKYQISIFEYWSQLLPFVSFAITIFLVIQGQHAVNTANETLRFQKSSAYQDSVSKALRDSLAVVQFKVESRPYLIAKFEDDRTFLSNSELHVRWRLDNVGRTPALNVRFMKLFDIREISPDTLIATKVNTTGFDVGYGIPEYIEGQTPLFKADSFNDRVYNGNLPVFIGLKIEYTDFLRNVHHSYSQSKIYYHKSWQLMPSPLGD